MVPNLGVVYSQKPLQKTRKWEIQAKEQGTSGASQYRSIGTDMQIFKNPRWRSKNVNTFHMDKAIFTKIEQGTLGAS